jgi:reactive chlorine resistance protein C
MNHPAGCLGNELELARQGANGVVTISWISNVIGSSEIVIALLIATRPFSARLSSIGSVLAVGTFLATLSFLVTTPGIWHFAAGFPVPVPNLVGAFLIKDLFLLGASVWTAGEAAKGAGYHA